MIFPDVLGFQADFQGEMLDPFLLAEKFQPSQRMVLIQEGWKVPTGVPAEWLNGWNFEGDKSGISC